MAFIPADARWYIAEIVEEFQIEGELENVVHINWVLVRADSAEGAYEGALSLGSHCNARYVNPEGKNVTASFRGLKELNVIFGELTHGTELIYEKRTGLSEDDLLRLVSSKENLNVFRKDLPD